METAADMDADPRMLLLPLGNIDGIVDGVLSGWFFSDLRGREEDLVLVHDGVVVLSGKTGLDRPDVHECFGAGSHSGFTFNLMSLNNSQTRQFRMLNEKTGFDFHGAVFSFDLIIEEKKSVLQDIFNSEYYRYMHGLHDFNARQAFEHYMVEGIYENLDPSPYFSNEYFYSQHADLVGEDEPYIISYLRNEASLTVQPSKRIDVGYYANTNQDLAGFGSYLQHFVKHGASEGRRPVQSILPVHLTAEIEEIMLLEPAVVSVVNKIENVVKYPYITGSTYLPRLIERRYGDSIKAVVCVPFITRGGADLIATFLLKAYQQAFGKESVLLIVTDHPTVEMSTWVEEGTLSFCLDDECAFVGMDDKVECLHHIVGLLCPEKLLNVNSHVAWDLVQIYGRQLASVIDIYAYLFCFDYDANGRRVGYIPGYVPSVVENVAGFFCDNSAVIEEMKKIYGFSGESIKKFHPVYVPFPDYLETRNVASLIKRERVLWIGRIARQKRPDVLLQIAASMPGMDFDVYGPIGDSPCASGIVGGEYENVHYRGVYSRLTDLNLDDYKLFLNTSSWDGLPTILIQMMKLGLPIVTSSVGGISELVTEENGFIVDDISDIAEFVSQINRVFIQNDICRQRVDNGLKLVNQRHTWSAFYSELSRLGAFTLHVGSIEADRDRRTDSKRDVMSEGRVDLVLDHAGQKFSYPSVRSMLKLASG